MTMESDAAMSSRPAQIKPKHLKGHALIYVRQSSRRQVLEHTGSTAVQRSQALRAQQWGWSESAIKVVDDDLGLSGTSSYQRLGFQEMLDSIDRGNVGLVMFHDVARLSREPADAEAFLRRAVRAGVLIATADQLFDAGDRDLMELFGFRVKSLLAWYENVSKARNFRQAKFAKIKQGHAVSRPPVGYTVSVRGQWIKDPDLEVRAAIRRVFDLYRSLGSVPKVARHWDRQGLLFPCRHHGQLTWRPVTERHIKSVLTNAHYSGDYIFGRTQVVPVGDRSSRQARTPEDEWHIYRDHHEPYISREEQRHILDLLRSRRVVNRQPARGGKGLLQSLLWCTDCGRRLLSRHQGRRRRGGGPSYVCATKDRLGVAIGCFTVSARLLDPFVTDRILRSITPPAIEDVFEATEAAIIAHRRVHESQLRLLQHAAAELERAEQRWLVVDPTNKHAQDFAQRVVREKAEAYNDMKRTIDQQMSSTMPLLTRDDAEELMNLARDVEALWRADTTTNEDRKDLIRAVISRIELKATEDWLDVTILWKGGLAEVARLVLSQGVNRYMAELRRAGATEAAIQQKLNEAHIVNAHGKPIRRPSVWRRLRTMGLNSKSLRIPAYRRVRQLALEQRTRPEMLEDLLKNGPPHPAGMWTRTRVDCALKSLLRGGIPGIDPFPIGFTVATTIETDPEVIETVVAGRKAGRPWRDIEQDLEARGLRPLRAARFSRVQLSALFRPRQPERRKLVRFHPTQGRRRFAPIDRERNTRAEGMNPYRASVPGPAVVAAPGQDENVVGHFLDQRHPR